MSEKAPEEIAAEIQDTRRRLTATVDALAERTDVRGRARVALGQRLRSLRDAAGRIRVRLRQSRRRTR